MPIGIQRLNTKKSHPNPLIVFIKPLKGPDEAVAQDFLERIAAQCCMYILTGFGVRIFAECPASVPVMKEHHVSVMSLEEYEPNNEFVGRNFNAGEVVQLVLKARFTGRWLPFEYVQVFINQSLCSCRTLANAPGRWS